MKAYADSRTVYINDFIRLKHKKEELSNLKFRFL